MDMLEEKGLNTNHTRLIFNSEVLDDEFTLEEYNIIFSKETLPQIKKDSTIVLKYNYK